MISVVFEASTIVHVIKRVEKAAPPISATADNIGNAGIVIDVHPSTGTATVRATNGNVFYREVIDYVECDFTERAMWRMSSSYLARIIATFKTNSGSTVTFSCDGGLVEITQDRKKAKLGLMGNKDYPDWYEASTESATNITDLGAKIKYISWASSPSDSVLRGIYMKDGYLYATNNYVMARMPCTSAGEEPIVLDASEFDDLIDQRGDMNVAVIGGTILLAPNDRTQIRCSLIGEKFKPVDRATNMSYPISVGLYRDEFLKLIRTTESVQTKDKQSVLRLFIGDKYVAGIMEQESEPTGIRDIIDVLSGAEHDLIELDFNPAFLSSAISNCPDEEIEFHYDPQRPRLPIMVKGSEYQAWVTPIEYLIARKPVEVNAN